MVIIDLTKPPEPLPVYIVCKARKNEMTRIDVRICETRCKKAGTCKAFREYKQEQTVKNGS